eukprot:TRINITY_DN9243_c0_g1_i1.p1 TRINITY_DN9243_c0_g1~~TRINITY_DN9243_c0_g1_i1.p1  ORF type:complete len:245 (-),score=53.19 TRINITY_DN9243_c0_g1_i1:356-1090(-)
MSTIDLFLASDRGDLSSIEKLLKNDVSLVSQYDMSGKTALHWSAWLGRKEVVKLMVTVYKADVNMTTSLGLTPLHCCAWTGKKNVLQFLLDHGADVDRKDGEGKTAMDRAREMNHLQCIDLLQKRPNKPVVVTTQNKPEEDSDALEKLDEVEKLEYQLKQCQIQLDAVLQRQEEDNQDSFLTSLLQCPVCFEMPQAPPIPCCKNGHILCSPCRRKLKDCPKCRVELTDCVSQIAADILEKIKKG